MNNINPQSIVHPVVYVQNGTSFTLNICTPEVPSTGVPAALEHAVAVLNALEPTTQNCMGCGTWESPPIGSPDLNPIIETTVLHELGHCALGLDHPDRNWNADGDPKNGQEGTSFTRSWGAAEIRDNQDMIRGSRDDTQRATGGQIAESVSWFRRLDNNPVIVDPSTVIDINSYSRSVAANLPPGDTWAANANLKVAESLGEPETQALMYAVVPRGATYFGLSADDVNMIKMQRTGPDLTANTSDDYTLQIDVVPCTMPHQIEVGFLPLPSGVLGACESAVDYAYPQPAATARVFKVVPDPDFDATHIIVLLNDTYTWDTKLPLFGDGFEAGDFSSWSAVFP